MSDVEVAAQGAHALTGIVGAAGGGLGVLWLARILFKRMIDQYDKRHDEQAKKLERVAEKFETSFGELRERLGSALSDLKTKVAVVETMIGDTRALRGDVQSSVAVVQQSLANLKAAVDGSVKDVDDLRHDVFVAHRRIEILATGDTDISKIQRSNPKRRHQ